MAQLSGGNVELLIGFESAFGTPIAEGYKIDYAPTSFAKTTQAINSSSIITGDPSPSQPFLGFKDAQVSLTLPINSKAFGLIAKGLFGAPVTVVDTPSVGINTHTYKRLNDVPSMWVEFNHTDVGGGLFYLTNGVKFNEWSLSLGGDGELLATFTGIGKDTTKATSTVATTSITDYSDGYKFGQFQAAITGTTAKIKTFDMNFTNNIDGDTYIIDGTGTRGSLTAAQFGVSGSMTTLFEDDLLFADSRAFTTKQFITTLTNGGAGSALRSLELDIEEAKLDATSNPEIAGNNGIEATFNYQGFNQDGTNATALQITLINDIVSYA